MGICQGRSCRRLVERILAEELHLKPEQIEISSFRQPVRPVLIKSIDEGALQPNRLRTTTEDIVWNFEDI